MEIVTTFKCLGVSFSCSLAHRSQGPCGGIPNACALFGDHIRPAGLLDEIVDEVFGKALLQYHMP